MENIFSVKKYFISGHKFHSGAVKVMDIATLILQRAGSNGGWLQRIATETVDQNREVQSNHIYIYEVTYISME